MAPRARLGSNRSIDFSPSAGTAWARVIVPVLALTWVVGLTGCSHIRYYAQAVGGQLSILAKRRAISEWLDDPEVSESLKQRLSLVLEIRSFASEALGLPENGSFRAYADLERSYVVWTVFAAPEFSLDLREWCYPVVGCAAYRGYFTQERAQTLAERLQSEGYDTYVAGAAAYSTLGWFDDPLLNTVIAWPEADLAGLIFHELAHQRLYIQDDSTFNESFASAVEAEGVRRWLEHRGVADAFLEYKQAKRQDDAFTRLVFETRERLQALYEAILSDDRKRRRKAEILAEMRSGYERVRRDWDAAKRYDAWFSYSLNNAQLGSVATYHAYVPAFQVLIERYGGDLQAFYQAAERLGKLPPKEREAELKALLVGARDYATMPRIDWVSARW